MKTIGRFFASYGSLGSFLQLALLGAALGSVPALCAVLIARQGFEAAYRDWGGVLALPVLILALIVRYLIRRGVCTWAGDGRFFADRLCILEICPPVGVVGVLTAIAAAVALGVCVNLFWFYIVGFFGRLVFFERVVAPDAE